MIDLTAQYLGDMAGCVTGRWQPRLADPDLRRWALTLSYLVAAVMVASVARRAGPDAGDRRRLLVGAALLLLLLGLNKQLDLQTFVRAIGHCESRRAGWYAARSSVRQPVAMVLIAVGGLAVLLVAIRHRRAVPGLADLLLGLGLLLGYLAVRIAIWNRLSQLVHTTPMAATLLRMAEPAGLGLIVLGAGVRLIRRPGGIRVNGSRPSPPR